MVPPLMWMSYEATEAPPLPCAGVRAILAGTPTRLHRPPADDRAPQQVFTARLPGARRAMRQAPPSWRGATRNGDVSRRRVGAAALALTGALHATMVPQYETTSVLLGAGAVLAVLVA